MSSVNLALGQKIHEHLLLQGIETPMLFTPQDDVVKVETTTAFKTILESMGLDLTDDSLWKTPQRIGKMYEQELFWGLNYDNFPDATVVENKMRYDEMIAVEGITVQSTCEHHFLPFIGEATVAYIPSTKVLGLSKFNRIVDFFCRRPQIQERLTEQIAATLKLILDTDDVAVVIRADHYCVKLRGVRDSCSSTVTSKLLGKFREVPELRQEFLALTRSK